jgi:hypothetical protein
VSGDSSEILCLQDQWVHGVFSMTIVRPQAIKHNRLLKAKVREIFAKSGLERIECAIHFIRCKKNSRLSEVTF